MHPISRILCQAYDILLKNGQVSFELGRDNINALDSVVKTVNASYYGVTTFPSDTDKAVAYLCHLIKRHALADGNKRLALLWFEVWCNTHDLFPKEPPFGYDALAITIEATDSDDLNETIGIVTKLLFP